MNAPEDTSVTVTVQDPVEPTLIEEAQVIPVVVARLLTRMLVVASGLEVEWLPSPG